MKIFSMINKNSNQILVVARNEDLAKKIAVHLCHAKNDCNLTAVDITAEYVENHGKRGFKIPNEEGKLIQVIDGNNSEWRVLQVKALKSAVSDYG